MLNDDDEYYDASPMEAWFDTMQELTLNNHELTLNNHERIDALTAASTLAAKTTTLAVNTAKTSNPGERGKKLAVLVKT